MIAAIVRTGVPALYLYMVLTVGLLLVIGLPMLMLMGPVVKLWARALLSGAPVPVPMILSLRMKRKNPAALIASHIRATKGQLPIKWGELMAHHLAGGQVNRVVTAMMFASRANLKFTWDEVCRADLHGQDVVQIVKLRDAQQQRGPRIG